MERLTEKITNKDTKEILAYRLKCGADVLKSSKKLGELEDLEEQGLLVKLPCKVGDKAWYVHKHGVDEVEIDSFIININIFANVSLYIGSERFGKTLTPFKTLFFNKEDAEKAFNQLNI